MKLSKLWRLPLPLQFALLMGCLLPIVWALIAYDLHRLHEQIRVNSRLNAANLARAFSEEVKSSVNAIDLTLVDLRDEWQHGLNDFPDTVRRRQAYLERDIGFQVAIINASGQLAFSSAGPQAGSTDLSDREHFRVHRQPGAGDRLFISEPVLGRITKRWSIQFTRPLIDANGNFAGVIVLSVSPHYFSRFYRSIDLGKDSAITLLRSSGEVLARSPDPDMGIGEKISYAPFLSGGRAEQGDYEGRSRIDGIERLSSWRRLQKSNLIVIVDQSLETIYQPYRQQRKSHLQTGLGLSVLLAGIAYALLAGMRQRATANAALVESEARWKFALEGAGEGVWDWNIQSGKTEYSARWMEILGFTETKACQHFDDWESLLHPDDRASVLADLQAHLGGATPAYINEHRMRCGDGSWKWVLERGMVVNRSDEGKAQRMVGTLSDITRRKQAETALQESMIRLEAERRRIEIILENSHDAFVAVNTEGQITNWNTRAEATFGWTAEEAIGQQLASLIIPEEMRKAHAEGFKRFASSGKSTITNRVIEVEALHRSGRRIPVELALAGSREEDGYAANAFIRDVSERKNAERLDIERLRDLDEARKALQHAQKLEALGRLTGGIAHDFNNILQTLTTGIQLARFTAKEKGAKSALEACERAVERGVELTRQLLAFGRVQDVHLVTVHPSGQIKGISPLLRGALPSSIDFSMTLPETLWQVRIDPMQFELALLNLTINARDAMPDGGRFSITGFNETLATAANDLPAGDYVRIVLSDTGEGMSADVLARALDPFFTTKLVGKGSGLGLPQAYGFAKQMGGTLLLESAAGKGLQISIYLPRAEEEPAAEIVAPPPMAQSTSAQGAILFVEDDPLVRQTVRPALEAAGFDVTVANDGDEALRSLASGRSVDLVFSDIVMPGEISGIDLAEIVLKRYPEVRVVLATGYSERRVSIPQVRTLAKPYSVESLVDSLNQELRLATSEAH